MAFPGPYAHVYYNEAGEPLGWDNEYPFEPDYDPYDDDRRADAESAAAEDAWERAHDWEEEVTGVDTDDFADWFSQNKDQWGYEIEYAWNNFLEWRERRSI